MAIWLKVNIPLWNITDINVNETANKIIEILEKEGFPDSTIEDIN